MMHLSLGFSPCPNDTFVFHALVHGLVAVDGVAFGERLEDVETLNQLAASGALDLSKVSYGAVPELLREYVLLRSGGALGRGCGPLLVARPGTSLDAIRAGRIAVPGHRTTASLLLRLWDAGLPTGTAMAYADIMTAVAAGQVEAGLIIHESRFTYPQHGLAKVVDLGEWWERETGLPIPLGGVVARRSLGEAMILRLEAAVRRSVEHAFLHPAASRAYVRDHARELDESVVARHIELYVNEHSLDIGGAGERAIEQLLTRAAELAGPVALPQA